MHGGLPSGKNRYHLVVVQFDNATGKRITDAQVTATIKEIGFTDETKKLETMKIDDKITYSNYFSIKNDNKYSISIQIYLPGTKKVINGEFTHEHFP